MHHETGSFTIPDIRDFIPVKVRPWIIIVFVMIYQLSGGVYLASVTEMTGSLALMQEDIKMAGYASLVGMALTFTYMYRLKFRFSIKTSLLSSALGLIICNLIIIHAHSLPVLVAVSFLAGILRMWGTFACNTTIQLWITPKRDMAVWFVFIYMLVQGSIQLTGLSVVYAALLGTWESMHWLIVGLLLLVMLVTFTVFRHFHAMKKLPLYGLDWMGMALWAATVLCIIYVLNYGEHCDWYQSANIRTATIFGLVALALNLWRASFIRHPFIALETWRYRNVWLTFLLYILVNILVSPAYLFEHLFTGTILGFDALHMVSLNLAVFPGIICGAVFSYYTFALRKWTFKTMTLIGFSLIVGYLLVMYFIIDSYLPGEMLYLPLFLRGAGYVIIAITFITALAGIPFRNFFQSLSVQAFVSACFGSLIGSAVLDRVFSITIKKNIMLLGSNFDNVNPMANHSAAEAFYGSLQQQAMMVSIKEIYGWLCILGIFSLLVFFLRESSLRPKFLHPKFSTIRHAVKHELKMDVLLKGD